MEYILSHLQIYGHYVTLICTTLKKNANKNGKTNMAPLKKTNGKNMTPAKKMTKNNMTPAKQNGQVNR